MKKQTPEPPKLSPEQIIIYCQQNFINIIPNTGSNSQSRPQSKPKESHHHEKQQFRIIMKQLSIFLQLTIQNCVLTSDPKIKSQSYRILGIFRDYLSRDLDDFENLIHFRNKTKLPFYEVDCRDFLGRDLMVKIPPQVSIYQDPLLFYNYSRLAQQQLFCNLPIYKTRQERIEILRNHIPFLDPNFIPIIEQRFQTKSKFNQIQDRMLLIMLSLHQKKDISQYKAIYFPNRHESQIRNRAKNLCAKEMNNPIKTLKENQYLPLTEQERRVLAKAYARYGARWAVISKYYNLRSPELLQSQYENCPKLDKLRKSYNIAITYPPLKQLLQKESQQQASEEHQAHQPHHQSSSMEIQMEMEERGERGDRERDRERGERMEEDNQPRYKIINHLTFLYQEI